MCRCILTTTVYQLGRITGLLPKLKASYLPTSLSSFHAQLRVLNQAVKIFDTLTYSRTNSSSPSGHINHENFLTQDPLLLSLSHRLLHNDPPTTPITNAECQGEPDLMTQ